MTTLKEAALKRSELYQIDPRILKTKPGFNPRDIDSIESQAHIEELAISIANIGVKQPLVVYHEAGEIYVTDGHCRLAATMVAIQRGADIVSVPCRPEDKYANDIDKAYAPAINNSGRPLNQLEQGRLFKRLIDLGQTESQIAERTGKSLAHVGNCLKLYASPTTVHQMISGGQISPSLAVQVIRGEGENAPSVLSAAVQDARAQGKPKATAANVATVLAEPVAGEAPKPSGGPSARSRLAALKKLFEEAITNEGTVENEDGTTTVLISTEDVREIIELLEI